MSFINARAALTHGAAISRRALPCAGLRRYSSRIYYHPAREKDNLDWYDDECAGNGTHSKTPSHVTEGMGGVEFEIAASVAMILSSRLSFECGVC